MKKFLLGLLLVLFLNYIGSAAAVVAAIAIGVIFKKKMNSRIVENPNE